MKKQVKSVSLLGELQKFVQASASGWRRKPDGNRLSKGTVETYRHFRKVLQAFSLKYSEPFVLSGFSTNKVTYRTRSRYWKNLVWEFTDYLRSRRYRDNYIWNNLKIFRALTHYLTQLHGWPDAGFAVINPTRLAQPAPITLSFGQMQELLSKTLDSTIQGFKLATIRDRIALGCFAAMRNSDLNRLQWQNIIERNENTWLEYQSKKTGMRTKILLPVFLRDMIMKHKTRRTKTIFPRISNVNLNKQVKRLGKYLDWDENTSFYKSCNGILKLERVEKFYRLLTTHTMRRTGISLMLQLGMPDNMVRKISWHAPNSKEFYKYIQNVQNWQDEETENHIRQNCRCHSFGAKGKKKLDLPKNLIGQVKFVIR